MPIVLICMFHDYVLGSIVNSVHKQGETELTYGLGINTDKFHYKGHPMYWFFWQTAMVDPPSSDAGLCHMVDELDECAMSLMSFSVICSDGIFILLNERVDCWIEVHGISCFLKNIFQRHRPPMDADGTGVKDCECVYLSWQSVTDPRTECTTWSSDLHWGARGV